MKIASKLRLILICTMDKKIISPHIEWCIRKCPGLCTKLFFKTSTSYESLSLIVSRSYLDFVGYHWVQSKRHRLWFSTKTCSCYSRKTHVKRRPENDTGFVKMLYACYSLAFVVVFFLVTVCENIQCVVIWKRNDSFDDTNSVNDRPNTCKRRYKFWSSSTKLIYIQYR